ncbi:hypothetical protein LSAT2_001940 [Lamellibrachia satsuma]|nr:hypothetical protein LSAT2_001940 [Lamellibrachia satsuma]
MLLADTPWDTNAANRAELASGHGRVRTLLPPMGLSPTRVLIHTNAHSVYSILSAQPPISNKFSRKIVVSQSASSYSRCQSRPLYRGPEADRSASRRHLAAADRSCSRRFIVNSEAVIDSTISVRVDVSVMDVEFVRCTYFVMGTITTRLERRTLNRRDRGLNPLTAIPLRAIEEHEPSHMNVHFRYISHVTTWSRGPLSTCSQLTTLASVFTSTCCQLEWELLHSGNVPGSRSPRPRRDAVLGYHAGGDTLVLFGGRSHDGNQSIVLADTWLYNPWAASWRDVSPRKSPPARHSAVAGVSGNYFYVATGEGRSGDYHSDIWRFDISAKTWDMLPPQTKPSYCTSDECLQRASGVAPAPRGGAAGGIMINSSILHLSHGFSKHSYNDVFIYSTRDQGWEREFANSGPYNPTYPHARHAHAGTMISEHQLLIFGGCLSGSGTGGPCPSSDTWLFDRTSKSWTSMDGSCAYPRTYAAMAMLPIREGQRKVVIFGGNERGKQVIKTFISPPDEVIIFDPDTDSCAVSRTTGDIPTKRASAAMVTGPRGIYMFGGYDLESCNTTGDLYLLVGTANSTIRSPNHVVGKLRFCNMLLLHGVFMGTAYGFVLIWGAVLGRYANHKGVHVVIQIIGVCLAIAGFVLGVLSVEGAHFKFVHGIIGLVVFLLTLLQPMNFFLCCPLPSRYPKQAATLHQVWKVAHSVGGYSCLALGAVNISFGVFLADAHRAIWITWFVYLAIIVVGANAAQYCRRRTPDGAEQPLVKGLPLDNYETSTKDTPL